MLCFFHFLPPKVGARGRRLFFWKLRIQFHWSLNSWLFSGSNNFLRSPETFGIPNILLMVLWGFECREIGSNQLSCLLFILPHYFEISQSNKYIILTVSGEKPHNSGGNEPWGKILLRGFEEDFWEPACHSRFLVDLRVACHNNSLRVCILSGISKKMYVASRKNFAANPRKSTVQRDR